MSNFRQLVIFVTSLLLISISSTSSSPSPSPSPNPNPNPRVHLNEHAKDIVNANDKEKTPFPNPGCLSNSDCGNSIDERCCVIGMDRYSIPDCQMMRKEGEACIPKHSPWLNFTLTYPNGAVLNVVEAYRVICPCSRGLMCDEISGECTKTDIETTTTSTTTTTTTPKPNPKADPTAFSRIHKKNYK